MVLIERPAPVVNAEQSNEVIIDPTPSPNSLQANPPQQDDLNANVKFFPNSLSSATDSGLLNVNKPVDITLNNLNPLKNTAAELANANNTAESESKEIISETEIHKRRIMLIILLTLFVILICTTCLLFVQKKTDSEIPIENPTIQTDNDTKIKDPEIKNPDPPTPNPTPNPNPNPNPTPTPTPNPTPTPPDDSPINVTKNPHEDDDPILLPQPTKGGNSSPDNPDVTSSSTMSDNLSDSSSGNFSQDMTEPNSVEKYWEDFQNKNKTNQSDNTNKSDFVKRVNVSARLRQPVVGFRFDKTPLISAIRAVSELTEIPISFDIDEMRAFGIKIDSPITGKFGSSSIGEILDKMLKPLNLVAVVENDQLTITPLPDKRDKLIEETIDISDIVKGTTGEDQLTSSRLVEIIVRLINPVDVKVGEVEKVGEIGGEVGGEVERNNYRNDNRLSPQIRLDGDSIFICSSCRKVDGVIRLLEQIRLLRELKQRTNIFEENLAPEVFGWDKVDMEITLNYYQETSLPVIFSQIERLCGVFIIVDHNALHRVNLSFSSLRGRVRANKITLNEAMEQLLSSISDESLTYRIVGGNILELTTAREVKQLSKMSVEAHYYKSAKHLSNDNVANGNNDTNNSVEKEDINNLENNETPEQIVETIYAVISPTTWNKMTKKSDKKNTNVGATNIDDVEMSTDKGCIIIDRVSSCLLIRQSQPVQRQIRTWFKQK
jgi:hypothetical protein